MKTLTRRSLFSSIAIGGAALALTGCVTTKVGTTTTATLNVAKIKAYIKAGKNAAKTVVGVLKLVPAVNDYIPQINVYASALEKAADAFVAQAGDKIEVSYDNANIRTLVDSILSAIQLITDQITTVIAMMVEAGVAVKTINKMEVTRDSLATIVSVLEAMVASFGTFAPVAVVRPYDEYRALKVLGA